MTNEGSIGFGNGIEFSFNEWVWDGLRKVLVFTSGRFDKCDKADSVGRDVVTVEIKPAGNFMILVTSGEVILL